VSETGDNFASWKPAIYLLTVFQIYLPLSAGDRSKGEGCLSTRSLLSPLHVYTWEKRRIEQGVEEDEKGEDEDRT